MRWAILFSLLAITQSGFTSDRDSDGRIYENIALRLRHWEAPTQLKSLNYPSPAPHELVQSWRFASTGENSAVKLVCNDISIMDPHNSRNCAYSFLSLNDGPEEQRWCSDSNPFTIISKTSEIVVRFYSGKNGGGRFSCQVQSIFVDADRHEVTGTTERPEITSAQPITPRPPYPTLSSLNDYRFLPSEEIDSSEHGGEDGIKSTSCACGWANKVSSRIVNGAETGRNEFPFAAALVEAETLGQLCGSTIITEYHAVTAAHCTTGSFTYNYSLAIIVGAHQLYQEIKPPAEVIGIERIVQHEGYTGPPIFKHDISLLILKKKLTFGPFIGPACLPSHHLSIERQYIKIIGWGNLYWQGPGSEVLKKVDVRVVTMPECSWAYSGVDDLHPTQICTFAKRGASCQGDSGGPVVWLDPETNRYTLVGAVSYGANCGLKPTVHTAIASYIDWIYYHVTVSKGSKLCKKVN